MENGADYEAIDADAYMTPPASSDDDEIDPMVELMELEHEEAERLAMQAHDKRMMARVDKAKNASINGTSAMTEVSGDATNSTSPKNAPEDEDHTDSDASDTSDDGPELLWFGFTPPWMRDAHADAANVLLVRACRCDVQRECRDPAFGELCAPMKRMLRSACWASHNETWLASGAAALVAKLLSYHSLHCDARGSGSACAVPLCAALKRS